MGNNYINHLIFGVNRTITSKDEDTKHTGEENIFINKNIEDCEIYILDKDRHPWFGIFPSYSKEGVKKSGGKDGISKIEKGGTLVLHHVKNKQRLMFVLNEIDYRQKGFEVTFDHGIECTCRVRFKNKKSMILIKIIGVDSHKTGIMTHIAGNIGHPDWKKKD
jgi:hypothetical protein